MKERIILQGLELASLCIRRFYCGMVPGYKGGRVIVILKAFVDESGDSIYALGGLVAPIEVWDKFCINWIEVCKEIPRISYYKSHDAKNLEGPFLKWNREVKDSKISKLASVIPIKSCYGIASYISKSDLNRVFANKTNTPMYNKKEPYLLCAYCLVMVICEQIYKLFPKAIKIDFIFDKKDKVNETQFKNILFDILLKRLYPGLGECFYLDDRETPPLQAADMMASWIHRRENLDKEWNAANHYLSQIRLIDFKFDYELLKKLLESSPKIKKDFRKIKDLFWNAQVGQNPRGKIDETK